jgi:hypothetical protein
MPLFDNDSSGKYYAQSLYAMINNRGVKQIYTPVTYGNFLSPL